MHNNKITPTLNWGGFEKKLLSYFPCFLYFLCKNVGLNSSFSEEHQMATIGYVRVSSDKQALERQHYEIVQYALKNDFKIFDAN